MAELSLEGALTPEQRQAWAGLDSPAAIQSFLDHVPYSPENANRCPRRVMLDRQAHCLDGGLFAAAALRRLGDPPLIVDLLPEPVIDEDHVIAVFRRDGLYGAIAKSNFVGLRYREPVYRTLRELVMSYFEWFFNVDGIKTLRAYTRPVDLSRFDHLHWETQDAGADALEQHLKHLHGMRVVSSQAAGRLLPVDRLSYQAGLLAANMDGLYRPQEHPAAD
ncbi:MAG: hypothetical protein VB089_10895 [Anaerolineaceae bacterium]|jgi:hypothetical protein|nr:hypothetical protein [Anaerolineaceae bacterium]